MTDFGTIGIGLVAVVGGLVLLRDFKRGEKVFEERGQRVLRKSYRYRAWMIVGLGVFVIIMGLVDGK